MYLPFVLAHGSLGIADELIPLLLVFGFGAFLVVAGIISRRNNPDNLDDAELDETSSESSQSSQSSTESTPDPATDHIRLD
jgi:hypothetical protein